VDLKASHSNRDGPFAYLLVFSPSLHAFGQSQSPSECPSIRPCFGQNSPTPLFLQLRPGNLASDSPWCQRCWVWPCKDRESVQSSPIKLDAIRFGMIYRTFFRVRRFPVAGGSLPLLAGPDRNTFPPPSRRAPEASGKPDQPISRHLAQEVCRQLGSGTMDSLRPIKEFRNSLVPSPAPLLLGNCQTGTRRRL
jgi:hypothetical protein